MSTGGKRVRKSSSTARIGSNFVRYRAYIKYLSRTRSAELADLVAASVVGVLPPVGHARVARHLASFPDEGVV